MAEETTAKTDRNILQLPRLNKVTTTTLKPKSQEKIAIIQNMVSSLHFNMRALTHKGSDLIPITLRCLQRAQWPVRRPQATPMQHQKLFIVQTGAVKIELFVLSMTLPTGSISVLNMPDIIKNRISDRPKNNTKDRLKTSKRNTESLPS